MRLFRYLPLATVVAAVVMPAGAANAGFLVSSLPTNPGANALTRNADRGSGNITTRVDVGGSNVLINSFGTFGQYTPGGNLKFVIFDDVNNSIPSYFSAPVAFPTTSTNQWYDAPSFPSFTLLAGTTYYIGVISDAAFTHIYDNPGTSTAVTGGGLTIVKKKYGNMSGSFTSPTNVPDNATGLNSFRAFQSDGVVTATPVPPTVFLAAGMAGLFGLRGLRSLRRRLA